MTAEITSETAVDEARTEKTTGELGKARLALEQLERRELLSGDGMGPRIIASNFASPACTSSSAARIWA